MICLNKLSSMSCAVTLLSLSLTFAVEGNMPASMKGRDFSTNKSSWQKDMLQLQITTIPNDKDLKEEAIRLFANNPLQADWFMQDTDRLAEAPVGADLNKACIPKNIIAYIKPDRTTEFEKQLIERALSELSDKENLQKERDALVLDNPPISDPRWLDLYVKVCQKRRLQRLANMKNNFPKILFIKSHMLRPSFYGYTEGLSCANFERNFVPGSSLCLLEWEGDQPKITELLKDDDGMFRDIDVSSDGNRILFAWKKSLNDDDYHLYEMTWPDRKVRQLTFGLSVADFEGRYLPNGDIIFSSSRCISTTDCFSTEVSNLYTCDKDGKFIRRLGFDQVVTCYPSVLDNGNMIYTRWDYNDRGQLFPQPLFQMNPDGTGQTEYYGNNSWFPTVINHARGIPDTDKVLAVLHGHHTWQAGELAIIDRNKGTQEASGIQIIAPPRQPAGATRGFSYQRDADGWIEPSAGEQNIAVDHYGQDGNLHRHPYPLTANDIVVAMTPYMNARKEADKYNIRFHLYWMDTEGRREMLVNDPSISCAHPIPLLPRKNPHVRPSIVDLTKPNGTFFLQNIYEGPGLKGIKRGTIKKLRVVALEFRALAIGGNYNRGRGGDAGISTPVSTGNGCWDVKKILGEANVYEDGSAMFNVPANTPVYFQAIDQDGSMVQSMRSWSTLMPNETFGCVGCHEDKQKTPLTAKTTLAMKAGVQELTPFYGPPRGFSFLKEIQPLLNKNCISCHGGKKLDEQTKMLMDLTDRRYKDDQSKRLWTTSYLNLTNSKHEQKIRGDADHKRVNWISAQSVPTMLPPYFRGSAKSQLMTNLRNGHGNTRLTQEELDKFAAWIDLGVPFCGDYLEANTWTDDELMHYIQMQRKRERLDAEVLENTAALIEKQTGATFVPAYPKPRYLDYIADRGIEMSNFNRGYRNLALNPDGKRGPFPKASSNSVCRDLPEFSPPNVINGKTDNNGHGKQFPSWGPDQRDDLWLNINLGSEVEIDKIVVYIRADFPHDSWWKSGVLEFSDGSTLPFKLKPSAAPQTIAFPKKKVVWVKFTNLVAAENKWCGFTEIQIWGK